MTPEERQMLNGLADKLAQTPPPTKDAEAEEFIRTKIGSRPDALYLMTQTVLIQDLALQHAQQQIQDLQQRSAQPAQVVSGPGFLGPGAPRSSGYSGSAYSQPGVGQPCTAPAAPNPGGAPSFLRSAAQTAAGVAAGALAFEAINSLFSYPGYGGGFGGYGGGGFMGGGAPIEENVVNNYYDLPQGSSPQDYRADDQGGNNANDVGNDSSNDVGNDVQNVDDSGQNDDSGQYDDSGQNDDSGQYDDSGGFDDSSNI